MNAYSPVEGKLDTSPAGLLVSINASAAGSDRIASADLAILSIFNYYNNELLGGVSGKNLAMNYVNSKYDLVEENIFKSNEFTYSDSLPGDGFTRYNTADNRWVLIGPSAFVSENSLAATIGHENVHYNQPYSVIRDDDIVREPPAYQWELDNANRIGLSASARAKAQEYVDWGNGVGPDPR